MRSGFNGEKWRYYCVLCVLSTLINVIVHEYDSNVSDSIQQDLTLLDIFLLFFLFIV